MMTDEQKITHILSCVYTHTPEQILSMIITMEDPVNADKVVFHPSFPKELREKLDVMVVDESKRVKEEIKRVGEESKRVKEESKRVKEEIKRADIVFENLRNQRIMVQNFNRAIEGELNMYVDLNSQFNL
jgi:hypothetical protein